MTITEFLLSRIAEDEKVARAAIRHGDGSWMAGEVLDEDGEVFDPCGVYGEDIHIYDEGGHDENHAEHIARHDPARVLAECAAKRAIIAEYEVEVGQMVSTREDADRSDAAEWAFEIALRALAAVYASHPDYREGWAL